MRLFLIAALAGVVIATVSCSCGADKSVRRTPAETVSVKAPEFSPDSAYEYLRAQVALGPRVPGTDAHKACCDYIRNTLSRFGIESETQEGEGVNYRGQNQPLRNIIARIRPDRANRLLLCAHWDTRPFADQEDDPASRNKPIDGANDGASGVAVMLETARQLAKEQPNVGVDLVFFDVEDMGTPEFEKDLPFHADTWCLGSQHWAKLCETEYRFGILLDMVGAPGATFHREQYSERTAGGYVDIIWRKAQLLGHGEYFVQRPGGYITDDHVYVNSHAGVPTVDIIDYKEPNTFGDYWHTHKDNMDMVSRETLRAVGETVLRVIRDER